MSEFIGRNIRVSISRVPEIVINAPYKLQAEFIGALMQSPAYTVPGLEKIKEGDKYGTGNEFITGARNNYWRHTGVTIGEELNVEIAAILFQRAMGSTYAVTASGTTAVGDPAAAGNFTTSGSGGSIPVGVYYVTYTYKNATGETIIAPVKKVTVTGTQNIATPLLTPLPTNATSVEFYMSAAAGSTTLKKATAAANTGAASTIAAVPSGGAASPPSSNTTVGADGVFVHTFQMQVDSEGRQLPLTTVYVGVGGMEFICASMVVDTFTFAQDPNGGSPTFSATMVGTGYWLEPADQTPAFVPPTAGKMHYMHTAASVVTLNDGTSRDLAAEGRLKGFEVTLSNSHRQNDRRPGDPFMTAGDVDSGAYVAHLNRGKREVRVRLTLMMDENKREWNWHKDNDTITSLKITLKGQKIGSTVSQYEFEITIPNSYVEDVTPDENQEDMIIVLELTPIQDNVTGGLATGRVKNNSSIR